MNNKRAQWKELNRQARRFTAAKTPNGLSGWISYQYGNFNDELKFDLQKLRVRSRDAAINDVYARRYFNAIKTNVVGSNGVALRMRVRDPISQAVDVVANNKIEAAWAKWSRSVTPDGMSWLQVQHLFMETAARDGEVLVQFLVGKEYPHGFALQFFEADHLDVQYDDTLANGNVIVGGVEVNEYQKVVAYHIWKYHPNSTQRTKEGNKRLRIPADQMLFCFMKERPGQLRGYPWLASALPQLQHIKEYTSTELVAARVAAAKMGFYTRPRGEDYVGDGDDESDERAVIGEVEPGIMELLPEGYSVEMFDPKHPVTSFGEFIKVILRGVAASVGVSYHTLASDLESASYSSLRQGAIDERETYFTLQRWFIEAFLRPVFEKWLELALLRQDIVLPAWLYDKFNAPEFRPRAFAWVDPAKEVMAYKMRLDYNLSSKSEIVRNLGRDFIDVIEEIAQEKAIMSKYGVTDAQFQQAVEQVVLDEEENPVGSVSGG